MRFIGLLIPVLCLMSLSACSATLEGMQKDWDHIVAETPDGYAGHNSERHVLKPLPQKMAGQTSAMAMDPGGSSSGVVWHALDYDAYRAGGAQAAAADPSSESYGRSVELYDIDDVLTGMRGAPVVVDGKGGYSGFAGIADETIYFGHGSSVLNQLARKRLDELAMRLKNDGRDTRLRVVGHASQRVNGVNDPVKRRMINLEMAQKRASKVHRHLKKSGVAPAWIETAAEGDTQPNPSPPPGMTQEAADRRVEIFVEE